MMQDWLAQNFGLEELQTSIRQETFSIKSLTFPHDAILAQKSPLLFSIDDKIISFDKSQKSLTFSNVGRGYFLWLKNDIGNNHPIKNSKNMTLSFHWNDNYLGILKNNFDVIYFDPFIIILISGPILLLSLSVLYLFQHPQQNTTDKIVTLIILGISILGLSTTLVMKPYARNYKNSYNETVTIVNKNTNQLSEMLKKHQRTEIIRLNFLKGLPSNKSQQQLLQQSFFPTEKQERNIHNAKAFISKSPFFPNDYIRINVDLFNYLFYSPNLTSHALEASNSRLTYRYLGNDIWLGQYQSYINATLRLIYAYNTTIILWIIVIGIILVKMIIIHKHIKQ